MSPVWSIERMRIPDDTENMTTTNYTNEWQTAPAEDRAQAWGDLAEAQTMSIANAWACGR